MTNLINLVFELDRKCAEDLDYLMYELKCSGYQADRMHVYAAWKRASEIRGCHPWMPAQIFRRYQVLSILDSVLTVDEHPPGPVRTFRIVPEQAASQFGTLPATPVGKIKSFGPFGPKYEVGKAVRSRVDGDWMIEITMIESGEKAEYPLSSMREDPEAE